MCKYMKKKEKYTKKTHQTKTHQTKTHCRQKNWIVD